MISCVDKCYFMKGKLYQEIEDKPNNIMIHLLLQLGVHISGFKLIKSFVEASYPVIVNEKMTDE